VDSEDTVVDLAKKKVFGNSPYILIPNTVTSRSFTEDVRNLSWSLNLGCG
jgi:hypothetical protein